MAGPWEDYASPAGGLGPDPFKVEDQRLQREAAARAAAAAELQAASASRAAAAQETGNTNTGYSNTMRLAGDYNSDPTVKAYRVAIQQFSQALNTGAGPQADLALTYAFAKAMDPESVVRESEQGMVTASQPWFQAAVEKTKKQFGMDNAGNFTPEARDALRQQIANSVDQRQRVYDTRRTYFEKQAEAFGIDPTLIIGEHDKGPFLNDIEKFYGRLNERDKAKETAGAAPGAADPLGVTVTDDSPGYASSYLGQGMSGLNEGIANTLGAPVDLTAATLNLVPQGINALANTNIPTIANPIGGSQWLKENVLAPTIYAPTADPSQQFTRRVAQSVGAAAVPAAGLGTSLGRAGGMLTTGLTGGLGAATAQQVAPGNIWAEMGGELAGGLAGGVGALGLARRGAQREIEAAIPDVPALKQQAGDLYRAAEARGVSADPTQTSNLATIIRDALTRDGKVSPTGRISEVYPKAKEAVQLVDDYAGSPMNPTQMQTVRKVMGEGMTSPDANERRLASMLMDEFDGWANPLAPELPAARNVASRYLNAQGLERAKELAASRSGQYSGSGFENALRTEYRALDRNTIKGNTRYSDELTSKIEDVSRGTTGSNIARNLGRFAPRGPMSIGLGAAGPAAIGGWLGGPAGAGIAGVGALAIGETGRAIATRMGTRAAQLAELTARNGGAIPQAPLINAGDDIAAAALIAAHAANYSNEGVGNKSDGKKPRQKTPRPLAR